LTQHIELVYPFDYYTLKDFANAAKRSIHAYDVVSAIDYAPVLQMHTIHAYDILPVYSYAYTSRRNVIHAYDIILQQDLATKSGNITLSVRDTLTVSEWFFRVSRALKIFELYTPIEFIILSTLPTIFAEDFITVYDKGEVNISKVISAFDKLVVDGISYTKSYSPLFFTLLRRRVPISYRTLSILDSAGITDYASIKKIIVVTVSDYAVRDSAFAKGAVTILISDYDILFDLYNSKNLTIHVFDIVPVVDYASAVKVKTIEASDYLSVDDYVDIRKPITITALDSVLIDSISTTIAKTVSVLDKFISDSIVTSKSYSPLLFALLGRRSRVRYLTLAVSDRVGISDYVTAKSIIIIPASDYAVSDLASVKGVTTVLIPDYSLAFDVAASRNRTIEIYDIIPVADYSSAEKIKTVEAPDYLLLADYADAKKAVAVIALEMLLLDSVSMPKSYSPLLFTLLRRRIPIKYLTLAILDSISISDYVAAKKIITIQVNDYSTINDFASTKGTVSILIPDYGLLADIVALSNRTIAVYDVIPVTDHNIAIKAKVIEEKDYIQPSEYVDTKKALSVTALETLLKDSVSMPKSYSPLLFTLLRRRIPIRYLTLSIADAPTVTDSASIIKIKVASASDYVISDYISVKPIGISIYDYIPVSDSASTVKAKMLSASDYVVFDSITFSKSYLSLFFSMLRRKVPIRYLRLNMSDRVTVSDSASMVKIKVVSVLDIITMADYAAVRMISIPAYDYQLVYDSVSAVLIKTITASDYIIYDNVPSINPSDIRYISLYANVGMRTVSVFDRIAPYESAWVGPRVITVHARDYLVSDSTAVVKRSIHAYDIIGMRENVNIVRL
jgi:hypothetical protein